MATGADLISWWATDRIYFSVWVGPSFVNGIAEAVRSAGLECAAGTERIYILAPSGAKDRADAREKVYYCLVNRYGADYFLAREFRPY